MRSACTVHTHKSSNYFSFTYLFVCFALAHFVFTSVRQNVEKGARERESRPLCGVFFSFTTQCDLKRWNLLINLACSSGFYAQFIIAKFGPCYLTVQLCVFLLSKTPNNGVLVHWLHFKWVVIVDFNYKNFH